MNLVIALSWSLVYSLLDKKKDLTVQILLVTFSTFMFLLVV